MKQPLVVLKRTKWELDLERFGSPEAVHELYRIQNDAYDRVHASHLRQKAALERLRAALPDARFVSRGEFIENGPGDHPYVISFGGDNHFVFISHFLGDLPLAGINSDPDTSIGALLGFLVLNWHPARIFLGDGGSIPLGYLLAFWLVTGVNGPDWAAAMILPAYFCWDATLTIFHRWRRGEKLTQGHRRHAYQQAIDRLGDPRAMTKRVLLANALLLGLALVSPGFEIVCILLAAAVVHSLISWMKRGRATAWLTL